MPQHALTDVFFFNDPATTELYTLSLHDALPISSAVSPPAMSAPITSAPITAATAANRLKTSIFVIAPSMKPPSDEARPTRPSCDHRAVCSWTQVPGHVGGTLGRAQRPPT